MNLCYLGNSLQDYTEYRKVFPQAETVFLCLDYLQLLRLESYNEQVRVYDDHVPAEQARAAQSWLTDLIQCWYLDGDGNDLSMFGQFSLGRLVQYFLSVPLVEDMRRILSIACGVEQYDPDVVAWGTSLSNDWQRACGILVPSLGVTPHRLEVASDGGSRPPTKFKHYEDHIEDHIAERNRSLRRPVFRLWQWLNHMYAGVQDMLWKGDGTRRTDILFLGYWTIEAIWDQWNSDPELRKRVRLGFLSSNPPSKSVAARALLHRCAVYAVESEPTGANQSSELESINRSMEAQLGSLHWRELLHWDGSDLGPVLTPIFQKAVTLLFPMAASLAVSLEAAIQRRRPKAVILSETCSSPAQVLCQLASTYRFKTVYIPHGFEISTDPAWREFMGETLNVDRIIAASESDWDAYGRRMGAPPQNVACLSFAPIQRAVSYVQDHSGAKLQDTTQRQALVLNHGEHQLNLSHKERTGDNYFFHVLDLLSRLGYRRVVYKLHPGPPQLNYWNELLSYIDLPLEVTIVKDVPIYGLMAQAELIVGPLSTAMLEAAVLDRPYLCVDLDGLELWPPLGTKDVPVACDFDSLDKLIQNYRDIWPTARRAILRDACGLDPDAPLEQQSFGAKLFADLAQWLEPLHDQP